VKKAAKKRNSWGWAACASIASTGLKNGKKARARKERPAHQVIRGIGEEHQHREEKLGRLSANTKNRLERGCQRI